MGDNLPTLIKDCKGMETLEELRLVNVGLNLVKISSLRNLNSHKKLLILDISNNQLTSMTEIADLLNKNQVITEINLSGNTITTTDDFTELLCGMLDNMSVTKLSYEISPTILPNDKNPLAIQEDNLASFEDQLKIN